MAANRAAALRDALAKLEKAYGTLVAPGDPVEGGVLAILATEAPALSTEETRDRIRRSFADWNEARVADPWDVTSAMEAGGDPAARRFVRSALAFLESVQKSLNRCTFEVPPGEVVPDWPATVEKMRGATPAARAVVLAMLAEGGWHATADVVKAALKLDLVGKTTSAQKVAAGLAAICSEDDRLRAHYLLARYGSRGREDADPLGAEPKRKAEKPAVAKPAKKPAPAKKGAKS